MGARRLVSIGVVATVLTLAALAMTAASASAASRADEFVIGGSLTPTLDALLDGTGAVVLRDNSPHYVLVDVDDVVDLPLVPTDGAAALLDEIRALAGVRFVEPHFVYTQADGPDPDLPAQTNLANLEVAPAWSVASGAGVTIAIADTGVDLDHPDLAPALVPGANFVDRGASPDDDGGHGTEVAGLAAARGGNGIGIAGVAYRGSIMPLKVLRGDGSGVVTDIADALRHAAAKGVRVVNLSLIGTDASDTLREALAAAEAAGVVVVVSAGNQGTDIDASPMYPAGYPNGNLVAVGSEQADRILADFSNRGPGTVDVTAPGVAVRTTERGGGYGYVDGTSMSSPQVAGTVALLASAHPEWSAAQLRDALFAGAAPRPVVGVGRGAVSAARSLGLAPGAAGGAGSGAGSGARGAGFAAGDGTATRRQAQALGGVAAAARNGVVLVLRAASPTRVRARGGMVRLRWRTLEASARVHRIRIEVDGRVRATRRRTVTSLRVRLRPGRHRWAVTALDRQGRRLVRVATSFRLRRAT